MITVEIAQKIIQDIDITPRKEKVPMMDSLDRVLSTGIISSIDMPPFDKAAMDGYAVNSHDLALKFKMVETIAAGSIPQKPVGPGECSRIMTGAMLPQGADKVTRKEVAEEVDGTVCFREPEKALNVCLRGEDVKSGDQVLAAGTRVRPQEIAILASLGLTDVSVFQEPIVGILATGSEIVEPGNPLAPGQIYNSNAYSLAGQVRQLGAQVEYGGIAADDKTRLREQIGQLAERSDMVIISGGVSLGDYDFVPAILEDLGVKLYFREIAIKPGKPTVFGVRQEKVFFGLPGNPVSTFVVFEIFVKPVLYKLMGFAFQPALLPGVMAVDYKRRDPGRTAFIPVRYVNGQVHIIEYHGSAHIHALSQANALLEVKAGITQIAKGSQVDVRSI
jgi:molybdopterin molybdotransferase